MKLEDLKHGRTVRFIEASGLSVDRDYVIHSVDSTSWTVRLDGVMGSYSIDHIVGFDMTPTIPSEESGTLRTAAAYPSGAPRVLPKPEHSVEEGSEEPRPKVGDVKTHSIFDALQGLEVVDLLDAMEGHLKALISHPDPMVKYHARNALMIQWTIESLEPQEDEGNEGEEKT